VKPESKEGGAKRKNLEKQLLCILLGIFAAFLLLFPTRIRFFDEQLRKLELVSRDLRMSIRAPQKIDEKIVVIGLTDLEHFLYGQEIDSRRIYQILLQVLEQLEVKAVLFDILFEDPKPIDSTLALKLQEIPSYLSYKFRTVNLPIDEIERQMGSPGSGPGPLLDGDAVTTGDISDRIYTLLDRIEDLGNQRLEAFREEDFDDALLARIDRRLNRASLELKRLSRLYLEKNYVLPEIRGRLSTPPEGRFVILPSELLLLGAGGVGFINVMKGEEEVVRKVPLFVRYRNRLYPHLDLVFLCDYYGVSLTDLDIEFGKYVEFEPTRNYTGTKRIPIDRAGNVEINFRRGDLEPPRNSVPLHQVLHFALHGDRQPTRIAKNQFKDAVVIVGEMTPGGSDVEPVPLNPVYPMVGIHASLINMIWRDDYVRSLPPQFSTLITLMFGLFVGIIFAFLEYRPASLVSILLLVSYIGICLFCSSLYSLFLPLVRPAGSIVFSYILLIFYILVIKEGERRKVRNIFLKSVSPRIGEEILREYDNEAIWGTRKKVTVLFADIRGFTPLSEVMSAPDLVSFLDSYYDTLSHIVFSHDGVVNKFVGDAVMALFGAPLELEEAEAKAVKAALDIQSAVKELNENPFLVKYDRRISLGIGIGTGEVAVGTVGRKKIRIEYTALGDTVNVADRLQGMAAPGEILINAETFDSIGDKESSCFREGEVRFVALAPMQLRGKEKPVSVYRVERGGL